MHGHARRHDPDFRPQAGAVRPARTDSDDPSTAATGLEGGRPAPPPASVQRDEPSEPGGFWGSLTTIERAGFLAIARETVYPAGAVLWKEGQTADHTIVIKSGRVRVCVERDGREQIIAFRGPGDIIGERAALLLRRRSATIVAMEPLHALLLTTQQFVTYLSDHPRVVAVMEREVYERLTEQQSGAMHGPQSGEMGMEHPYRAEHPYGAVHPYGAAPPYSAAQSYGAVHYGPPQAYAAVYVPIPPQLPYAPYATPAPTAAPPMAVPAPPMAIAASGGAAGPSWAGQNCTVVYTDIAGFSSRARGENDRIEMRRVMYSALRESFEESRMPWDACYREDRGDGALIVVPPEMPTAAVVDPMIAVLGTRLRRHNHRSSEAVRIQLRVAVDVGPVTPDPHGVTGWTVIAAARLLDAPPLKQRLAATGADLGFIASRFVYDSVIAHNPDYLNADDYEPIDCKVKETDIEGWIHLRGAPARSAL